MLSRHNIATSTTSKDELHAVCHSSPSVPSSRAPLTKDFKATKHKISLMRLSESLESMYSSKTSKSEVPETKSSFTFWFYYPICSKAHRICTSAFMKEGNKPSPEEIVINQLNEEPSSQIKSQLLSSPPRVRQWKRARYLSGLPQTAQRLDC